MKRVFALALVFILVLSLAACGAKKAVQGAVRGAVDAAQNSLYGLTG